MPRAVATHTVKDVKHWASKHDERVELFASFATDVVSYVATDGSNQVAIALNIHDMEGMIAYRHTPKAAAAEEVQGVIHPVIIHIEAPPPE